MYKRSEFTKRTYKTGEVADILHLHYQTVIRYDNEGILKFQRNESNRRVMFKEDLLNYMKKDISTKDHVSSTGVQFVRHVFRMQK